MTKIEILNSVEPSRLARHCEEGYLSYQNCPSRLALAQEAAGYPAHAGPAECSIDALPAARACLTMFHSASLVGSALPHNHALGDRPICTVMIKFS